MRSKNVLKTKGRSERQHLFYVRTDASNNRPTMTNTRLNNGPFSSFVLTEIQKEKRANQAHLGTLRRSHWTCKNKIKKKKQNKRWPPFVERYFLLDSFCFFFLFFSFEMRKLSKEWEKNKKNKTERQMCLCGVTQSSARVRSLLRVDFF